STGWYWPSMIRLVMVMMVFIFAGLRRILMGLLAWVGFRLQRHESGGVAVLIRQFHKNNNHCARRKRERPGSLEHIVSHRMQMHLRLGRSHLDSGLSQATLYADLIVRMIRHIDGELPVLGHELYMKRARHAELSSMRSLDGLKIFICMSP